MNLITKAELAKRVNRSAQYIDKAQKKHPPVINFVEDGKTKKGRAKIKVDPNGELTKRFIIDCLERGESSQRKKTAGTPSGTKLNPGNKQEPAPASTETLPEATHATSEKYGSQEKHELEKIKIHEQIEQLKIKNQQTRAVLIEKALVKKLFGRIYAIDQDQFKTINVNVTPKISAAYNSANYGKANQILELIEKQSDKELKSDINKILESGEPDRILEMNKILEDATGMILKNIQREITEFLNQVEDVEK